MWTSFKKKIFESPLIKTIISVFNVLIAGILTGSFVTEIAVNGELQWRDFYKTTIFYLLLLFAVFLYIYQKFLFNYERSILNFMDDDYCKAYMRKEYLPELARKTNELIKSGQDSGAVRDILDDLNLK